MTENRVGNLPGDRGVEGNDVHLVATEALQSFFDMVEDGTLLEGFLDFRPKASPGVSSVC
jgi:hypothetical protein